MQLRRKMPPSRPRKKSRLATGGYAKAPRLQEQPPLLPLTNQSTSSSFMRHDRLI
jgi:hypothetical protein